MACFAVGESVVQAWEEQQQSIAFVLLDPSWWGYILGCFLPGSSLYTLKQVCKAWRDLTASSYYTNYAPLRITTKLLGRLTSSNGSLPFRPAEQRLNILKQVSLQCGGRICLGLPRTAVEFHGIVIELLRVTGPAQQITVSLDTNYVPVVGALHGLVLRSSETLVDLKLRGARVAQQLCAILQKSRNSSAARPNDNVTAVDRERSKSTSTTYGNRSRLLLLPQLRILETDNVYLLRDLHAPRLLSLFVDYNSVPLQFAPPCASNSESWSNSTNGISSSDAVSPAAAENTITTVCRWLSAESNGFPRLVLLEFLARSGACLQKLIQAAILPMWSYPRIDETLLQDADTRALLQMGVSLPSLKELSLSDVGLLVHLHTVNLATLTLELPQVAVLPVLFQHHRQQQLAAQLHELVLRLSPYKPTITANAVTEGLNHSATCALYKRIHGRLSSSPFPSSSYEAIGLSLQRRSRRAHAFAQKTDEKAAEEVPCFAALEALCWGNGDTAVTERCLQAETPEALISPSTPYRSFAPELSPAGQQQQQRARWGATAAAEQSNDHPQLWWKQQRVTRDVITTTDGNLSQANVPASERHTISDVEDIRANEGAARVEMYDADGCPLLYASKENTAYTRNNAPRKQTTVSSFRRHRTWTSNVEDSLNVGACFTAVNQGSDTFANVFVRGTYEMVCAAACNSGRAEAANAAAAADSPPGPSPVVVLLNLTHLTAPWSLLGLLVCPNLRQLHVTGMIQRVNVLNFLQAAAPSAECLLIDKMHIDFKVERGEALPDAQERSAGAVGRKTADVFGGGENAVSWRLLQLKKYKGPAALLSDDVDCPNLEHLEVTDEDTTGELARFLFATRRRCPRLKRLSLRSLCPTAGGVTQVFVGTLCTSSHSRASNISERETITQGEIFARRSATTIGSCAFPRVISKPHEAATCVLRRPTDAAGGAVNGHLGIVPQTPLPTKPKSGSVRPSTSRVRRSWFDHPATTKLYLLPSLNRAAAVRGLAIHDSARIYTAAGAVFSSTTASVAASGVPASNYRSTFSSPQDGLEALHLSRLNARQVVDWLPVAPPVARLLLMQVKKLYVDHLEEGRKAMARLLAALSMLEYVEIQRSAGMTEKLLTACFAFRGFHLCRKQLPLHRTANTGKQAAQWCFVRQQLRERRTGEADALCTSAPVAKQMLMPLARGKRVPAKIL